MRNFLLLFLYLCGTNALTPAIGTTSRVLNGTISNGTSSEHAVDAKPALHSTSVAPSVAPVHEHLNEELMPQHMGREHVFEHTVDKMNSKANLNSTSIVNKTDENMPNKEISTPHKNHVVPKNGVSLPPNVNLSTSASKINASKPLVNNVKPWVKPDIKLSNISAKATVLHKKPLILESDSDSSNELQKQYHETPISVPQIDPVLLNSKPQRAEYIIPIVGVILSVPVVAILMSIIYKRGADWWRYRNYKRMDFLIEGMYQ